jgi:hypothetical protein
MRIHLIVRTEARPPSESGIFQSAQLPPWNGSLPIVTSLVAHLFVLLAISVAAHQMALMAASHVDLTAYHVEFMKLRVPDPLYYRATLPGTKARKAARPRPSSGSSAPASEAAGGQPQPVPGRRGVRIPKNLELPPMKQSVADAPLILQPPTGLQAPPLTAVVPPLAFWARQEVNIPKPPPRPFIAPGRVEAPTPPPQLETAPVLAVPNRELRAADLNMAAAVTVQAPALPVQNSATVPVRIRDSATEAKTGGIERQEGEAANVIAISPTLVPPGQVVAIPKGLQNVPVQGDAGSGQAMKAPEAATTSPAPPTPKPSASPSRAEAARPGPGNAGNAADRPPAKSAANSQGTSKNEAADAAAKNAAAAKPPDGGRGASGGSAATASNGRTETASPGGRGAPTANASAAAPTNASASSPNTNGTPASVPDPSRAATQSSAPAAGSSTGADAVTRILHPAGGNFDVVIMQSATRADLSDVGSILTGNPVYTVYLPVGDAREWVMEYCVPASENARNNPYEVYVGDATPISAPYPISTVIPNSILGQAHRENIVFHGYLTVNGSFRNIEVRDQSSLSHLIAPLLNQWKFRPALKDKVPAEIEILLVVPARI